MSDKLYGSGAQEVGLMGAAVVLALLETLVAKDMLDPREVRDLLQRAIAELRTLNTEPGYAAVARIRDKLLPIFEEEGSYQP